MENNQSFSSNSRDTSPTSRDAVIDNNNHHSYKVKFICCYGGKIQPRPHDNHLSYLGGDTKILAVDRNIKFDSFMFKLSSLANNANICFKYQLPGEDLDALISVTDDEDLHHMMVEYDRLSRVSPTKPVRMKLILFPLINNAVSVSVSVSSPFQNPDFMFVDALNSAQIPHLERSSPSPNPDFLFGFDNVHSKPPDTASYPTVPDSECEPGERKTVEEPNAVVAGAQNQIQEELQKLKIVNNNNEQQLLLHPLKINDKNGDVNGVDCYGQNIPEKVTRLTANSHNSVVQLQRPGPVHAPFLPGGSYTEPGPVYLIQTASGLYQAVRPVTVGPTYYAMPRMVTATDSGEMYNTASLSHSASNIVAASQVGVPHLPEKSVVWN
ncbi:putative PB1 domain-containing protein [Lupinus albus]|uniref:Putative PB1 domain-containing protein n=1 Tax=Lupinus albus TaxID=3870 RepID=A0A6A4P3D4_LUPAL|nr:putative PB1 domain-containing protein [Lupinus albus]